MHAALVDPHEKPRVYLRGALSEGISLLLVALGGA